LLYPPSLLNVDEPEVYTERTRTGCTPLPSRTSSKRDLTPAATETSSATISPALTFASSEASEISSASTAVPSPLVLPDAFYLPPPLLSGVSFVPPLLAPMPETPPWCEMFSDLTLALAAVRRGVLDPELPDLRRPAVDPTATIP
jgi:hypothetical protein